jgi:hypothetical protein
MHLDDVTHDRQAQAEPPVLPVVPASAWRNRSKTYGRKSGGCRTRYR